MECEAISSIENGILTCTDENFLGSNCDITCKKGYKIVGSSTTKCLSDRKWSHNAPTCESNFN